MFAKILKVATGLHLAWVIVTCATIIGTFLYFESYHSPFIPTLVACFYCGFPILLTSAVALGFGIKQKRASLIVANALALLASLVMSGMAWVIYQIAKGV